MVLCGPLWYNSAMKLEQFSFDLPAGLIARTPADRRDHSRLMCVDRNSGRITHHRFDEFPGLIDADDFLVINTTRVDPARLLGRTGDRTIEMLVVKVLDPWTVEVLAHPAKHLRTGSRLEFDDGSVAQVLQQGQRGRRLLRLDNPVSELYRSGFAPLPPYIKRKAEEARRLRQFDLERYQTVYAAKPGAVAAPTAGLHFTAELLSEIGRSHDVIPVNLTVGEATFQKITVEKLEEHRMGREEIEIPQLSAQRIRELKAGGKKLLAVGTTSVRSLETWAALAQEPLHFFSEIFIYPGFEFKLVDRLLTNFHLPESSLFILVSAFAGLDLMQRAYRQAIDSGYRFFSYGDAMLIL